MKYLLFSDIHGCLPALEKVLDFFEAEHCDMMCIMGDIINYGPRNRIPEGIDPKGIVERLNALADKIIAVRGNCDAEVDQMVLEFPIMADYALLELNGKTFYATHGHIHNADALPPMQAGDILIHGHTHLLKAEPMGDKFLLNPGSTSLAKGGNPNTYGMLDENVFTIYDFDGNVIKEITL